MKRLLIALIVGGTLAVFAGQAQAGHGHRGHHGYHGKPHCGRYYGPPRHHYKHRYHHHGYQSYYRGPGRYYHHWDYYRGPSIHAGRGGFQFYLGF